MTHRIFGRAGSGKTEYMVSCLKEAQSAGADCVFLVPEQQSLDAEQLLEDRGAAALNTEVLNFERLPDRVFREVGVPGRKSVDAAGKCALLALAMERLAGSLSVFSTPCRGNLAELSATISALKRLGISDKAFAEICEKTSENAENAETMETGFAAKLRETALIYAEYQKLLGDRMQDDDDPLTRLAKAEKAALFFKGKAVFIDGIYTFTPQEYAVIRLMAENAAALYVSFTSDEDEMFEGTLKCAAKIKELARGKTRDIFLTENHRTKKADLLYGEEHLFSAGKPYGKVAESIRFAECKSAHDEALYAAKRICELREKGLRFGDIAIAVRRPENYAGVLDSVLASYRVPFYFARKDSALSKPLSAFALALLEMAEKNMPLFAVKKYLKSGFSVLSEAETDTIVHYAESWKIRGKAWTRDRDWLLNPEGYSESFSPEAEERLREVNRIRAKLAASIAPVVEALQDGALTVGSGAKALYRHAADCKASEKLSDAAAALAKSGDADGGAKTAAMWGVFVDALDRLYALSGEVPATAAKLRVLLEAMLESANLGAIPSYADAVNIGDARLMRASGVRAMIVLGVDDGVFPSLPEKSGVFSAKESALLEKQGVSLLPSPEKAVEEERFFFYNCAAAPSEYLDLCCIRGNGAKPSLLYRGLQGLFPHNETLVFGKDERDRLFCRKSALDELPYIKDAALKAALKRELFKDAETAALLSDVPPLQDENAYIGENTLQLMTLSSSRIDRYNNCGFQYLLHYILHLKDDRRLKFSAMNAGSYLHRVMEIYMKKRVETGAFVPADRGETEAEIDAITEEYMSNLLPEKPNKRLQKLIGRLKNAAAFVCENLNDEFSNSGFTPVGFELWIGKGGVVPPVLVTDKGRRVTTVGRIDRLDEAFLDGKRCVRVADYKSGKENFTVEKVIDEGEKTQMLSYLFSYCDAAGDGTVPVGVLYRQLDLPKDEKPLLQRGILLKEKGIAELMDRSGRHIKGMKKADAECFSELKEAVYNHIRATADRISDGVMCASPFKKRKMNCKYCPYGEVCRKQKQEYHF